MISPEEFAVKMRQCQENKMDLGFGRIVTDVEEAHLAADRLMCEVLRECGYVEGVEVFERMNKYYA